MRKGISLVALVITIIVLIILAAAVMLTGANTPGTAKVAVFLNDAGNIQDAVTIYRLNHMAEYQGVLPELTDPATIESTTTAAVTIDEVKYYNFASDVDLNELGLQGVDLSKWALSENGKVAHKTGIKLKGSDDVYTYYNVGVSSSSALTGSEIEAASY